MVPPPPPELDLSESHQQRLYGAGISFLIISILVTGLRFLSRRILQSRLWWDDWLMIVAFFTNTILQLVYLCSVVPHGGLGKHIWALSSNAALVWAKGIFIGQFFYITTLAVVKVSLLFLYWRVYPQTQIRIPIYITGAIIGCWWIAIMPVTLFQCKPVDGYWERFSSLDPTHPDCIVHTNAFADGSGVPNIITDILMLLLPLLFVWQLQLRNSQMIALLGVFALGIFNIIISIVRLVYTLKFSLVSPDYTWDFTQAGFWTMLECSLAIICANLPTLRPLLDLLLHGAIQGRSRSLRPQPMSGKLAPSPFPASVHARLPPKNGSIWPSVKSASGSEEEDEDHLLRRDSEDPWVIRGDAKSVAPGRSTERSPQAHKAGEQVDLELRDLEGGVKRAINVGAFTPLDGREERQIDM